MAEQPGKDAPLPPKPTTIPEPGTVPKLPQTIFNLEKRAGNCRVRPIDLGASPRTILALMRGSVVSAHIAHPDVLHVEVRDSHGYVRRLASQDAEWSPSDPAKIVGLSIEDAWINEESAELRCRLSDGSLLEIKPAAAEAEDDPPAWELICPSGVVLEFGPGVRWQFSAADPLAKRVGVRVRARQL